MLKLKNLEVSQSILLHAKRVNLELLSMEQIALFTQAKLGWINQSLFTTMVSRANTIARKLA